MELRKHIRFQVEVPIFFSWKDPRGIRQEGRGYTRDISPRGVFVYTEEIPPVGTYLSYEALFPALGKASTGLRMQVDGQVLRVEPAAESRGGGFATIGEKFALHEQENGEHHT